MLFEHTGSVSVIETLGPKLADKYEIISASCKRRQWTRMADMMHTVLAHRQRTKAVLIDSYSTYAFWYTVIISLLCRFLKIPYIPILHGGNYPERLKNSKFWSHQVFTNSITNVAPSAYLREAFKAAGFQTTYIPNHIEITNYSFRFRLKATPRILWVRAFHKIYNPNLAIDTVSILANDFPDLQLCMIGPDKDGSMEGFRKYAEFKGVKERIEITGKLSQTDWTDLSKSYDIFLNTTDIDNTPVSIIEAMSLGMPIVSTNVGGLPYLLRDRFNALLVPARDPEAMALAIKTIIDNPDLCKCLSFNARKSAEEFSWEKVSPDWYNLLDNFNFRA